MSVLTQDEILVLLEKVSDENLPGMKIDGTGTQKIKVGKYEWKVDVDLWNSIIDSKVSKMEQSNEYPFFEIKKRWLSGNTCSYELRIDGKLDSSFDFKLMQLINECKK